MDALTKEALGGMRDRLIVETDPTSKRVQERVSRALATTDPQALVTDMLKSALAEGRRIGQLDERLGLSNGK